MNNQPSSSIQQYHQHPATTTTATTTNSPNNEHTHNNNNGFKPGMISTTTTTTNNWYVPIMLERLFNRFSNHNHHNKHHDNNDVQNLPESDGEFSLYDGRSTPESTTTSPKDEVNNSLQSINNNNTPTQTNTATTTSTTTESQPKPQQQQPQPKPQQQQPYLQEEHTLLRQLEPINTTKLIQQDYPANEILVRAGPNYKKNGKKLPSQTSLYEFQRIEVLKSDCKIYHIAETTQLPGLISTKLDQECRKRGLPTRLVINVQLPNKGPSFFGGGSPDPGTSVIFYFTIRSNVPLPPPEDPSVKLCQRFFAGKAPGRFKVIGFVDNLVELGIASFVVSTVEKFNGKPVIVYKTGAFFGDPVRNYSEIDVDVHAFPFLVKTSLDALRNKVYLASLRAAFVIQGETDDELPERLLGCALLKGLDLENPVVI
jgi:hypothetical protein